MAKTIDDYKKDYAAAQAAGDKAGMAAANNAANALRQQQGQAVQVADVTKEVYGNNYVGSTSAKKPSSSSGSSSTTPGNSASGVGGFTDWQQDIIDKMNQNSNAWHGASQADKDRLHAENEYLSGLLGGNVSFDKNSGTWNGVAEFPAFSYDDYTGFIDGWDQIIKDMTNQILGREDFEYDYTQDPNYQQYREAYTREGERAMQDTIGEVAARTGGLASSYAASAANQANNYYMSALADKIPELRQMAYEAYLQNIQSQRDDLSMLLGLDNIYYQRWNEDRNFDYGVWRDQVNDQRYEQETDYNKQLAAAQIMAAVGDFSGYASIWGLTEDQTKLLVDSFAQQQATSQQQAARELADWYAQYGDFSKLGELGVDTSYLKFMQNQDYLSAYSGGSSGGSSGSKSSNKSNNNNTGNSVIDIMLSFNDDFAAKQYLLGLDLSQWEFDQYYSMYEEARKNSQKSSSDIISTNPFDIIYGEIGNILSEGAGMNEANFNAAMRSIAVQLESGNADFISDSIDDMWDKANLSQKIQLENLLAMYGYEHTD